MPKIIGFSIAKNVVREKYPIELVIEQHKDLFDEHWIGVPREDQDEDGTREHILAAATNCGQTVVLYELNWPGEGAWTEESLDRTHQQEMLDYMQENFDENTWFIKIDADEFYWEGDFELIKDTIDVCHEDGYINTIWTNYLQFVGSVEYFVDDPTHQVFHIFRNKKGVRFGGNDAMILVAEGEMYPLDEVYLHHIGYVKDADRITTRIREHIVLNQSMYPDTKIPKDWKFEFPVHKKGAKLWPLGIAVLRGAPNEVEYTKKDYGTMPQVLFNHMEKLRFFIPEE